MQLKSLCTLNMKERKMKKIERETKHIRDNLELDSRRCGRAATNS